MSRFCLQLNMVLINYRKIFISVDAVLRVLCRMSNRYCGIRISDADSPAGFADIIPEILKDKKMFRKKRDNCRDIFREFSSSVIPEIDSYISEFFKKKILNADSDFMREILGYVGDYCLRDGKRIRPLLLFNAYYGYRKGFKKRAGIIKLGAVVELMHSLLLIQDDIIDKSELRRGEKSLHILLADKYSHLTSNPLIGQDIASVTADILF